jgi:hypothetical protein
LHADQVGENQQTCHRHPLPTANTVTKGNGRHPSSSLLSRISKLHDGAGGYIVDTGPKPENKIL